MAFQDPRANPPANNTFPCPHCGAEVPARSQACPECGADEETGWAADAEERSLDLPTGYGADDEFNHEDYVAREFGEPPRQRARRLIVSALAILAIAILTVVFVWTMAH